jgi:hypothetical protein
LVGLQHTHVLDMDIGHFSSQIDSLVTVLVIFKNVQNHCFASKDIGWCRHLFNLQVFIFGKVNELKRRKK